MTNFKGTKGKWFIQNISYIKNWINISSDKGIIARTFFGEEEPIVDEKEAEANAKLIACAPEMLEMLEKCKEYFLLKTDLKNEERADAIADLIERATK